MTSRKEYLKNYMATRRAERRAKLIELAGGSCNECGSTANLEFNHIDRKKKSFGLSGAGLDKAWATILEELEKCELLCQTHHKSYTKNQWNNAELAAWNKGLRAGYEHGTARSYDDLKCRCPRCRLAKKQYRAKKIKFNEVIK